MVVHRSLRGGLSSLAAASVVISLSLGAQAAPHRTYLPAGTVIPVKLDQALGSKTSQVGDRFTATVRYGRDDSGLPIGTKVEGVVREARAYRDNRPGVLDLDFRRLVFPGGEVMPVTARITALNSGSIRRTSSGRLVSVSNKNDERLKFVGIGAGAGLLIAAISRGNTLQDMLLGAGAGLLYNELRKDKPGDVSLRSGSQFGVRLDQQAAALVDDDYMRDNRRIQAGYTEYDDSYSPPSERNRNRDDYDRERSDRERPSDDPYYNDRRDSLPPPVYDEGGRPIEMLVSVRFGQERPYRRGDVVYVPLEAVSRAAGFSYRYDRDQREISLRNGDLRCGVGSRFATLNGERHRLPGPAEVRGGVVYVPIEFVALATDGRAEYDSSRRTIIINGR